MFEFITLFLGLAGGLWIGHEATKAHMEYRVKDATKARDMYARALENERKKTHDLRAQLNQTKP